MPIPVLSFEKFRDDVLELATLLVTQVVEGEKDLLPMMHARFYSGATTGWGLPMIEHRNAAVNYMRSLVREYKPLLVGVTFSAWTGPRTAEPRKEAVVGAIIDREVIEVNEARLVRHDGIASIGAWRKWPLDDFYAQIGRAHV